MYLIKNKKTEPTQLLKRNSIMMGTVKKKAGV